MANRRITLRLSDKAHAYLDEAERTPGVTKNKLIEDALCAFFDPNAHDERTAELIKRLQVLERRQIGMERELAVATETLGQFVLYWLTRTEPLAPEDRETSHALGRRRFDHFVAQVANKLATDGGVANAVLSALAE